METSNLFGVLDRAPVSLEHAAAVYAAAKAKIEVLRLRIAQLEDKCLQLELTVPFELLLSEDEVKALEEAVSAFSYDSDDPSNLKIANALCGLLERAENTVS